jgi:hypothetical protein
MNFMTTLSLTRFVPTAVAAATIPENDAVDWLALADQLFPADALRTAPAVNPQVFVRTLV